MKINLASIFVDDQDKALSFYTQTLGSVKETEMPVASSNGWVWLRRQPWPGGGIMNRDPGHF